jgi:hypothetical protein
MTTIEISNEEIERKFDESERKQAESDTKPAVLSKSVKEAFVMAKKASMVYDAECTIQVAELTRIRETDARMKRIGSVIPDQPKSREQSNLFDF